MTLITVGDFLGVVSLNQDIIIYDINGVSLYEGSNATVPFRWIDMYVNSAWVAEGKSDLVVEIDYDVDEDEED